MAKTGVTTMTNNMTKTGVMTTTDMFDDPYLTAVYDVLGDYLSEVGYFDAQVAGSMLLFSSRLTWEGVVLTNAAKRVKKMMKSITDFKKESPRARTVSKAAYSAVKRLRSKTGIEGALSAVIFNHFAFGIPRADVKNVVAWHRDVQMKKEKYKTTKKAVDGMLQEAFTQGDELWRVNEEVKVANWTKAMRHEAKGCKKGMMVNNVLRPELAGSLNLQLVGINKQLSGIAECTCAHYVYELTDQVQECITDLIRQAGPKAVMINIPLIMENTDQRAMLGILIEDYNARLQTFKDTNQSKFVARAEIFFYRPNNGPDALPITVENPPSTFAATPSGVANVSYTPFTTAEQDTFALEFKIVVLTTLTVEESMKA